METITTIYGDMDPNLLEKSEGAFEDDNENTSWVEYRLNGELVHRSVHVRLKRMPESSQLQAGSF